MAASRHLENVLLRHLVFSYRTLGIPQLLGPLPILHGLVQESLVPPCFDNRVKDVSSFVIHLVKLCRGLGWALGRTSGNLPALGELPGEWALLGAPLHRGMGCSGVPRVGKILITYGCSEAESLRFLEDQFAELRRVYRVVLGFWQGEALPLPLSQHLLYFMEGEEFPPLILSTVVQGLFLPLVAKRQWLTLQPHERYVFDSI